MDDRTLREYAYPTDYGVLLCYLCGGGHNSENCQVNNPFAPSHINQEQFVCSQQQHYPYSESYTHEWRNHPNTLWNNQYQCGFSQQNAYQQTLGGWHNQSHFEEEDPLRNALAQLTITANQFMAHTDTILQSRAESHILQDISIRNADFQLEQITQYLELESQQQIFTLEQVEIVTPEVVVAPIMDDENISHEGSVNADFDIVIEPENEIIEVELNHDKCQIFIQRKEMVETYYLIQVQFPPNSTKFASSKKSFMKKLAQFLIQLADVMKLLMKMPVNALKLRLSL